MNFREQNRQWTPIGTGNGRRRIFWETALHEPVLNDVSADIGQPKIATLEAMSEL